MQDSWFPVASLQQLYHASSPQLFIVITRPLCLLHQPLQSSYPLPLEDDMKPLSYYGLSPTQAQGDGAAAAAGASASGGAIVSIGEILLEEVSSHFFEVSCAKRLAEALARGAFCFLLGRTAVAH